MSNKIFIGTIALEKNRWVPQNVPACTISDWLPRFAAAGFDGMELWEKHVMDREESESLRIKTGPLPVGVFNTYCNFLEEGEAARETVAGLIKKFNAPAVKYNIGNDPALEPVYRRNLLNWASMLPPDCRLLCECHPGTILEQPKAAAAFFEDIDRGRFGIIIHPLFGSLELLKQWFELFNNRIRHVHLQLRDRQGQFIRLNQNPALCEERFRFLRQAGYDGSFTIEFTAGVRGHENPDQIWDAVLEDLHFLRRYLE